MKDKLVMLGMALLVALVVGLIGALVVWAVQNPAPPETPPPNSHQVCHTYFMPVSTGKSFVLIPYQSCHNEPNEPSN